MPSVSHVRTIVSPGVSTGMPLKNSMCGPSDGVLEARAGREVRRDVRLGEEDLAPVEPEPARDGRRGRRAVLERAAEARLRRAPTRSTTSPATTRRRKCSARASPVRRHERRERRAGRQVHVDRERRRAVALGEPLLREQELVRAGVEPAEPSAARSARDSPASAITGQCSAGNVFSRSCSRGVLREGVAEPSRRGRARGPRDR